MSGKKGRRNFGWIRKRASGRYQASYIGPDNVTRHFAPDTFELKIEAEEWLAGERRRLMEAKTATFQNGGHGGHGGNGHGHAKAGQWLSPRERADLVALNLTQRKTVAEYGRQYIEQRDLRPKTLNQYTKLLEAHIIPKLGDVPISSLTPAMVRAWYASTLKDKPTYRAHAYQLFHGICATAVKDELLDRNPCMIDGATSVKTNREAVIPSIEQMDVIAEKITPKFKALIMISAWCGLRFGEVTELRRKDISPECAVISVRHGVTHLTKNDAAKLGKSTCNINTPKSGKVRKVIVPEDIRADIQHHLDTYAEPGDDGRLFVPVRGGCHVVDRVVRPEFRKACASADVHGMRIHDMRHFAGSQSARVGNLIEVMRRQGHSTQSAAMRYIDEVSGRDVEVADALNELLRAARNKITADTPKP